MSRLFSNLFDVSIQGPDELRRTQLLSILVKGMLLLTAFGLIAAIISDKLNLYSPNAINFTYLAIVLFFVCTALVLIIKRFASAKFARIIFLSFLTVIVIFSDEPIQIASGRAAICFAIPIIMASVLFAPYASFILASIASVIITIIAVSIQITPDIFIMLSYFLVALVSWLAARNLENALHDIRVLNADLDKRVKERTRDLAKSLARNKAIIESSADGVLVFNNDNRITVANQAMAELISRPINDIVGSEISTIFDAELEPGDREAVLQYFAEISETKSGLKFRCRNRTLAVSLAPIRDANGEEKSAVALFRDFSKEAEVDRLKSTFVSTASHELRTPISAIMCHVDMLLQGVRGKLTKEQQGTMERVAINAEQMIDLVNNLLDKSMLEAGKLQLDFRPFSVLKLLVDVMDTMHTMKYTKKIKLGYKIGNDIPNQILGDERQLRQILINLVNNAIKHTDKGSIRVHVFRPDVEHWVIEVKDTGCGIPLEGQKHLFDPFRQDDQSSRKKGGFGLGLSIVKQIVDHMNGVIKLQSAPGKGSTFTVELPFAEQGDGKGPYALVVDDDPSIAELYSYAVSAAGFNIETKESGDKAMEWLKKNTPGLVILDLNLPGVSGMDILQYIRNESRLGNVKVIVVTGYLHRPNELIDQAEHVLTKPFNPFKLCELAAQYYNT